MAYAAPEVVRKLRAASPCEASTAQDVWSLGMILWQMYSQQPLWGNEAEALAALGGAGLSQQHRLDPPMGCVTDVQARHLIGRMLQRKPAERIDVAHILRHGYLSGGMDTVEMDETFGPLHKGFVFARSLTAAAAQQGVRSARARARARDSFFFSRHSGGTAH